MTAEETIKKALSLTPQHEEEKRSEWPQVKKSEKPRRQPERQPEPEMTVTVFDVDMPLGPGSNQRKERILTIRDWLTDYSEKEIRNQLSLYFKANTITEYIDIAKRLPKKLKH